MASAGHIAARRDLALKSLQESGRQIAALLGIDPPELNVFYRDYNLLQAEQLQVLAEFSRQVQAQLEARENPPTPEPVPAVVTPTRAKRGGK